MNQKVLTTNDVLSILAGMPDPIDHATGLEKKELMAIARGNDVRIELKYLSAMLQTCAMLTINYDTSLSRL